MGSPFRTSAFRLAGLFAAGLAVACLLLSGFIYWQTTIVEAGRVDRQLVRDAAIMAGEPPAEIRRSVERRVAADFHRMVYAALFAPDRRLIAGNLPGYPAGLPADGRAHRVREGQACCAILGPPAAVHMVAHPLPDGDTLVIGRNVDSLADIRAAVLRALELGLIPSLAMALAGGLILGLRTQRHVAAVRAAAGRIVAGELDHRLPSRRRGDEFEQMVDSVNRMLDELAAAVEDVKSTSDHIAHDLRTPLTRLRTRLERACETAGSHDELRTMVERAMGGLDQALQIMAALMRIRRLDAGHCAATTGSLDLASVAEAAAELYQPVAEDKGLTFTLALAATAPVAGDRDLLLEAAANLVDNAVKYTPAGGHVRVSVLAEAGTPVLRVADDGVGIPPEERGAVLTRFYRSGRTRHIEGCGLGLALVDSIARFHHFHLRIRDAAPGTIVDLVCAPQIGSDAA